MEVSMEDITLKCVDCGKDFVWTVGEQEYYKAHGLENQPKRCADCRKARKARRVNNFAKKEASAETTQASSTDKE